MRTCIVTRLKCSSFKLRRLSHPSMDDDECAARRRPFFDFIRVIRKRPLEKVSYVRQMKTCPISLGRSSRILHWSLLKWWGHF